MRNILLVLFNKTKTLQFVRTVLIARGDSPDTPALGSPLESRPSSGGVLLLLSRSDTNLNSQTPSLPGHVSDGVRFLSHLQLAPPL